MRVGLHALGIGPGARPEVVRAVAMAAEAAGFATLWAGEHVVVAAPPAEPADAATWVQQLAAQWGVIPGM